MTSKIFRSTLLIAAVVLLSSLTVVMGVLYDHFSEVQVTQLKDELSLAVTSTEQYGNAFLENVESERFRITWIAADGTVLFDTQANAADMANHADREEIREALETGFGSSARQSDTLTEKTIYEAVRLQDGSVLRISTSQASATLLMLEMLYPIIAITVIAIALCALLARHVARKVVEPINQLDLEHPLGNQSYEEIAPLLRRINHQHLQIAAQIETLTQKNDEFKQITENMQEGLVLINSEGNVLSINPTAMTLFATDESAVGKQFLRIDTSPEMRSAVNAALDHGRGALRAKRNGRDYQFDLNRIASNGNVIGAAILAFDVTEVINAEQTRREFSANVSHELKTPLQSIIGSAELLENGLVKAEDVPRFVGHIRKEATRLVSLIEDIIRLSQLDEGVQMPAEQVDLLALAQEVAATLEDSAARHDVHVSVTGIDTHVEGVRRLLYEILYNLCDNAIRYNKPGGSVTVTVGKTGTHPVVTVADTGIGIAPEDQSRIFERFYRVDKSHSKLSGGTGLGLSIVKHAAHYHNAALKLESTPGEGTKISVTF